MSSITQFKRHRRAGDRRRQPGTVVVALVQMSCLARKRPQRGEGPRADRRGGRGRGEDRLPAGAVRRAVSLPERGPRPLRRGRADSRPDERRAGRRGAAARRGRSSARCSSAGPPGMYHNTAVVFDADGTLAGMYRKMHIPDDPLYYEKFYFTPGDLGFRSFRHALRPSRRLRLLGPVVSRGGPADGAWPGRRSSSIRRRSAGCPTRRPSTAPASTRPGKR